MYNNIMVLQYTGTEHDIIILSISLPGGPPAGATRKKRKKRKKNRYKITTNGKAGQPTLLRDRRGGEFEKVSVPRHTLYRT